MGREALCGGPELFGYLGFAWVALLRGKACKYAFDVAIEDRRAQAHAQAGDRAGGGQADARQFGEFLHVAGKLASVLGHDNLRGLLQVARAGVVTQAGPQVQHLVFRCGGQGFDRWQGGHEAVEVIEHGADLGLLQHDLRDPHPVGRDALLPGQVMATVAVVPVQYRLGKLLVFHRLNRPFNASFNCGLTLSSFSSSFSLRRLPAALMATWPRPSLSRRHALAPSSSGPRQRSGTSMPWKLAPTSHAGSGTSRWSPCTTMPRRQSIPSTRRSMSPLPLTVRPGMRTFRSGLLATPLRNVRLPFNSWNGVSLARGSLLKVLRLSRAMPVHSCCSRLALSSTPLLITKLALPLRLSISAFWLLPRPLRLLSRVIWPLIGGVCPWACRMRSTGTCLIWLCSASTGISWRTSRLPLAWKLPL